MGKQSGIIRYKLGYAKKSSTWCGLLWCHAKNLYVSTFPRFVSFKESNVPLIKSNDKPGFSSAHFPIIIQNSSWLGTDLRKVAAYVLASFAILSDNLIETLIISLFHNCIMLTRTFFATFYF
jgi:hypothetical protein